ncbi:MAG: sigma-54-dependent Fis family transcriptional regulator [Deltaproteobacteria bacterium]|nr:sigma-54-dependent Fis family transcriptional regulator [Deltaproteobacteria bacterium]
MTTANNNNSTTQVLIVDDEEQIRKLLQARFTREGWTVALAEDGNKAVELTQKLNPMVIVTDIKMPGLDGFQLVTELRRRGNECPVVMITGHGEKECAIEALHRGAFDYLEKPFEMEEIAVVVRRALEREDLRRANTQLLANLDEANKRLASQLEVKSELLDRTVAQAAGGDGELLVGKSEHIKNLKDMARTLAESFVGENDPVVLVTGESGTGKEMVARYMHSIAFAKEKPFVAINCAAFPDNLLESELFGYEKGAFTGAVSRKLGLFELANGGTLFLDEIGEMELKMQAKLLRALQERVIRRLGGTVDISVRPHIIAATNRDLAKMVGEGTFREDLYYRLNTLPISVAPLRSRVDDVEVLANFFLKQLSASRGKRFTGFSASASRAMATYRWPGNIRELKSVVERAVILEKGPVLELSHLRQEHLHAKSGEPPAHVQSHVSATARGAEAAAASDEAQGVVLSFPSLNDKSLGELRKEMDERLVRQVLIATLSRESGNVSAVARVLRLDRANLLRMLKRYTIEPELFRNKTAS